MVVVMIWGGPFSCLQLTTIIAVFPSSWLPLSSVLLPVRSWRWCVLDCGPSWRPLINIAWLQWGRRRREGGLRPGEQSLPSLGSTLLSPKVCFLFCATLVPRSSDQVILSAVDHMLGDSKTITFSQPSSEVNHVWCKNRSERSERVGSQI